MNGMTLVGLRMCGGLAGRPLVVSFERGAGTRSAFLFDTVRHDVTHSRTNTHPSSRERCWLLGKEHAEVEENPMCEIQTSRLVLKAATLRLAKAELEGLDVLSRILAASVPQAWPRPLNDEQSRRWAFSRQEVRAVIVHTLPDLTPSIRVLEKCGFLFVGKGPPEEGTIRHEKGSPS